MKRRTANITVAIITKNRPDDLKDCLESLVNQTVRPTEIIIVDSSNVASTKRLVASFVTRVDSIRYIHEPRRGFPLARNRVLTHAKCAWIAFTDDDCVVDKRWVESFHGAIRVNPAAAAFAGESKTYYPHNMLAVTSELNESYWKASGRVKNRITDLETLDNKNVVYNAAFLKRHAVTYDESRIAYAGASDDCDLGMQIQKAGGIAYYISDAIVYHKDPVDIRRYITLKLFRTRAHATYEQKWIAYRAKLRRQSISKWSFIQSAIRNRRIPIVGALTILWYLALTYAVIRWAKFTTGDTRNILRRSARLAAILSVVVFIVSLSQTRSPVFLSNASRASFYSNHTRPLWWRIPIGGKSVSTPVIDDNTIYAGGTFPRFYAFDLPSGKEKWHITAEDDIPFSPAVSSKTVTVASVDGTVFNLDKHTGKERWRFSTLERHQVATTPLYKSGMLYLGVYDTYLYALRESDGKQTWRFKTGGFIESSPVSFKNLIIFGSYDGYVYALERKNGTLRWKFKTNAKIIASPSVRGSTLFIGSKDSFMYALDARKGTLKWKTKLDGPIEAAASVVEAGLNVGTTNGTLVSMNPNTGSVRWKRTISGGKYSTPAASDSTIYYGGFDRNLYAINAGTGENRWTYKTGDKLWGTPAVTDGTVFFTSDDGYLYAIDRQTGKTARPITITIEAPDVVGWRDVWEATIRIDESLFQIPSSQASISATLRSESGSVASLRAFYAAKNTWKVRFAPQDVGRWTWTASLSLGESDQRVQTGNFICAPSSNEGFIYIDPDNHYRFVTETGAPFRPIGMNDALLDFDNSGSPFDNFGIDEKKANLDAYLSTYGPHGAGMNMFRFSVENASFPLWSFDRNWNIGFPTKYGDWGDVLLKTLRKNGYRVYMSVFGFTPIAGKLEGARLEPDKNYVRQYLQYVVSRYGAYVDVWELGNEAIVTEDWAAFASSYLASIDPYKHPIALSWEWQHYELPHLSVTAPHLYEDEPETQSDLLMHTEIEKYRWGKPIIFGEQGNKTKNWDNTSATRMRLRIWTTFFEDAGILFWNTSGTKSFSHAQNANIYLGPVERAYIKHLTDFFSGIGSTSRNPMQTDVACGCRIYSQRSKTTHIGYIHHFADHSTETSMNIPVTGPGTMVWINPSTGAVIRTDQIQSGAQTIKSPLFTIDIAYTYTQ